MLFLWIALAVVLALALIALHREIYYYDGAHLDPRILAWFYTTWAKKYDLDKQASQAGDAELLIGPFLKRLPPEQVCAPETLVLDVATGTGRFPLALLREKEFGGRLIALDISRGMLERAAQKLIRYKDRLVLVRHAAMPLPFPDNTFEAVSCVEALELMPDIEAMLAELSRVLRPGGVLVTSRCTKAWGRKLIRRSPEEFTKILQAIGVEQIEIASWWEWFDRVLARKSGQPISGSQHTLTDVLRCSACGVAALTNLPSPAFHCRQCGAEIPVSPEGIVLL